MLQAEKDHYSLIELAEHWKIPFKEIEYYSERNRLEVRTWVGDLLAIRHVLIKSIDGKEFPVQQDVISLNGYFIVPSDELRKIYRTPGIPEIRKFQSLDRREVYTLYSHQESHKINMTALEVSNAARERFETELKIRAPLAPRRKMRAATTPSGGRPSFMNFVVQHFENRAARGRLKKSLSEESAYLEVWGHKKLGVGAPIAKTIANKIGPLFTSYKAAGSRAA